MKKQFGLFRWLRRNSRLLILAILAAVTLVLGVIGFRRQFPTNTFLDHFYLTLQLFILQSGAEMGALNWQLQVARFCGAFFSMLAAIQLMVSIFYNQFQLLWIRVAYRRHIIICGLGGIGPILAERYLSQGRKVVIIEIKPDNKFIQPVKEQGGIVLIGDGADAELLRKAGIAYADLVVAVCGSDGKNAEIVSQVSEFAEEGSPPTRIKDFFLWLSGKRPWFHHRSSLRCYAHIINLHLCHYLAGQAITSYTNKWFQVEFFNIFDSGARMILEEESMGLSFQDGSAPHLAVIGLNEVGQSLIVRAERAWRKANNNGKLQLTVIDTTASEKMRLLECSCPTLQNESMLEVLDENVQNAGFLNSSLDEAVNGANKITQVYICLDDDSAGLTLGLMLLEKLREKKVPILVCLLGHGGLAEILMERRGKGDTPRAGFEQLQVFDLLERTCDTSIGDQGLFEDLAISIHERYCADRMGAGETPASNPSLLPWFPDQDGCVLSDEKKEDNRRQARRIGESLWRIGYGIEPAGSLAVGQVQFLESDDVIANWEALLRAVQQRGKDESDADYFERLANSSKSPERQEIRRGGKVIIEDELEYTARQEHESWLQSKLDAGWKPGVRSDREKTNPYLYPWYHPLLDEEKARQHTRDSVKYWPGLLESVNLRIYRR